ncbi:PREDICTED: lysosomal acid lipase/cholesteryl ester hydrolase-like, partial [Rhagoletis zephyria]|uniref:lysosomal acid lipase/cholesteryl ester hydrolase-like n=1 Tax=Rhagoletis zephyria TaxID=28612 RepID=UPI0008113427
RGKSTCELITSRNFDCEVHHVTTYQSYIVELHRIPSKPGKPVALLQTGLIGTSADFVIGEEKMVLDLITLSKSLAFELSRAGYDVWLSNNRGSVYGKGHQNLSSESGDPQFWKFSFDEIARYDVPAVIDYVLNQTKQESLHYIGHSQGAATMFALLSETSSVNRKLASFTAISPVTRLGKASTSFQLLLKTLKPLLYTGRFAKFDHGLVKNLQLYGSSQPPEYNLTLITFSNPLTVIYSNND